METEVTSDKLEFFSQFSDSPALLVPAKKTPPSEVPSLDFRAAWEFDPKSRKIHESLIFARTALQKNVVFVVLGTFPFLMEKFSVRLVQK